MSEPFLYNPIVRTFGQVRAEILSVQDLHRHDVRPNTNLEEILPAKARRQLWQNLQRRGFRLTELHYSKKQTRRHCFAAWLATAKFALWTHLGWASVPFLVAVWILSFVFVSWSGRHKAAELPPHVKTVEDLVMLGTCFADHKESGYRWTKNEIALKVRLIIAEQAALSLDEVQPERSFFDLGIDC
jgi:hypothetical protein